MKRFLKKILVVIAIIITTSVTINLTRPTSVYAYGSDCRNILGLTSWDCNVIEKPKNQDEITSNIITIAGNVFADIVILASYLVIGYVIYGGYLYIFSSGDPSKVTAGKKTLTHAFIGLAIVLLTHVILNTIRFALLKDGGFTQNCISNECINPTDLITNTIQWVISVAGIVAAVFVVISGIGYITSSGDPGKLKKAKDTLTYALIGLVIVGLAEVITAFVSNIIKESDTDTNTDTSIINETIISKESYES